ETVTEVFVVDLPEDLTASNPGQPLAGTPTTRPNPPAGVEQRRITFSERGIQGPRHWLRSTPDGKTIGFLAQDAAGHTQLFGVSPNGGATRQLTHQAFSIQTPFNFSPDGHFVAYAADNSIFITDLRTGHPRRLTPRTTDENAPINGVIWSNKGDSLVYNRYVSTPEGRYIQVFRLQM
ncbi:MAG: DPP IV N-terminal domain-containing protein, partial [Bacteroidetes bacterium]|nr:DPP IV N-terminal domain-containing protein [Bacteroidota bacterium]